MATATQLMTVEEFLQLPEDQGYEYSELHGGEIVKLVRPKAKHFRVQRNLRRLLEEALGPDYLSDTEFAYRPLTEFEVRVADVILISETRYDAIDLEGYFCGVPEIVVEVLSPSNTVSDLRRREKLSLENGGLEFWVIDPDRRQVKVSTPDGRTVSYGVGQKIPLESFGGTTIPVDEIFR